MIRVGEEVVGVHFGDVGVALAVDSVVAFHDGTIKYQYGVISQGRFEENIISCVKGDNAAVEGVSDGITITEGRRGGYWECGCGHDGYLAYNVCWIGGRLYSLFGFVLF